jgi:hypothetical protein
MKKVPFYGVEKTEDHPFACVQMIAGYHGAEIPLKTIRQFTDENEITSLVQLSKIAENIGLNTHRKKISLDELKSYLPLIVQLRNKKFMVVYKFTTKKIFTIYPEYGKVKYPHYLFKKMFIQEKEGKGSCMVLTPGNDFNLLAKKYHGKIRRIFKVTIPALQRRLLLTRIVLIAFIVAVLTVAFINRKSEQEFTENTLLYEQAELLRKQQLENYIQQSKTALDNYNFLQKNSIDSLQVKTITDILKYRHIGDYYRQHYDKMYKQKDGVDSTYAVFLQMYFSISNSAHEIENTFEEDPD